MKIPHDPILRLAVGALSLLALDACNRPSDPAMSQPVAIHVKASAMPRPCVRVPWLRKNIMRLSPKSETKRLCSAGGSPELV